MIVTALPDPAGPVTGSSAVCQGANGVAYSVAPVANATSYQWTIPSGAVIVLGNTTNNIVVDFGMNAVSGDISVYGTNSCGSGTVSQTFPVTVNTLPQAPVISSSGDTLHSSSPSGNQWYYNGTAIANGTGQDLVAHLTGWYWDVITQNGCSSDTSNHINIIITGTAEISNNGFSIYPVPNDGLFTIRFVSPASESCDISVINNIGAVICRKENVSLNGNRELQIDLRPVPPGVYTVICSNGGTRIVRKIIVDR